MQLIRIESADDNHEIHTHEEYSFWWNSCSLSSEIIRSYLLLQLLVSVENTCEQT